MGGREKRVRLSCPPSTASEWEGGAFKLPSSSFPPLTPVPFSIGPPSSPPPARTFLTPTLTTSLASFSLGLSLSPFVLLIRKP